VAFVKEIYYREGKKTNHEEHEEHEDF